jgi:tetratricopeptide (TPR) repeat protein
MERLFLKAIALDERFDYAGPDRSLGLLYLETPGWPASIGSKKKARRHLERAVKISPDYPGNRLDLADAALEWNDLKLAREQFKALEAIAPSARTNYSGPEWSGAWKEWDRRLKNLADELDKKAR